MSTASPTVENEEAVKIEIPHEISKTKCMKSDPKKLSVRTSSKESLEINLPCLKISLILSSKPIIKSKKYIPILERNEKVSDEVISLKGLYKDNKSPRNRAAKTQGIRIFSINLPNISVKAKIIDKNKKRFMVYNLL